MDHTLKAAKSLDVNTIALAGGVASNSQLRETLKAEPKNRHGRNFPLRFYVPITLQ